MDAFNILLEGTNWAPDLVFFHRGHRSEHRKKDRNHRRMGLIFTNEPRSGNETDTCRLPSHVDRIQVKSIDRTDPVIGWYGL